MNSRFILAISTSSGIAKVACVSQPDLNHSIESVICSNLVFQFEITDYKTQSTELLPTLRTCLQHHHLQSRDCVAIAVDTGPGGFTSLRTACGVAQGLALAWGVPTVPLTSFECMLAAQSVYAQALCLIDAKLNEVYAARISREAHTTQWLLKPFLLPVHALSALEPPVLCDSRVMSFLPHQSEGVIQAGVCAVALAYLGWQEVHAGRLVSAVDCQPLYVRDKVAQTISEQLALKHGPV